MKSRLLEEVEVNPVGISSKVLRKSTIVAGET